MPKRRRERSRKEQVRDFLDCWLVADVCSVVLAYVGSFEGIFARSISSGGIATCLAAVSDTQVVVGFLDGQLSRFNLKNLTKTTLEDKHRTSVCDLAVLPSSLVSLSTDGDLKFWDLATLRVKETRTGRGSVLLALPGDRFVCGADDGNVTFWTAKNRLELTKFCAAHCSPVRSLCLMDGCVVSVSADGDILKWDQSTFELVETLVKDPFFGTWYAQWPVFIKLDDGTVLSGYRNGSLINNGHVYTCGTEPVTSIAKLGDGFAALEWGRIRVWH